MKAWKALLAVSMLAAFGAVSLWVWEKRPYQTSPASGAVRSDVVSQSNLYPGGAEAVSPDPDPSAKPTQVPAMERDGAHTYQETSAYAVAEGKRLYTWFNCNGCHANGGGAIGPPLMDAEWLYGGEPQKIFASILEGRPNGMPSFRGKIPDEQVWQLVAYIRSMSGKVPAHALPGRRDDIKAKEPETLAPPDGTQESP